LEDLAAGAQVHRRSLAHTTVLVFSF
jgi:hypothetical protein